MKKFPINISDFKELIQGDYYYVDKSLLIKDILDCKAKVMLLPRPRRFGKSLNLTMLRYFLENEPVKDSQIVDNSALFDGLQITKEDAKYMAHQGKYPLLFLTFKNVKRLNWKTTYQKFQKLIREEYEWHRFLLESNKLSVDEKIYFRSIMDFTASESDYELSGKKLCEFLSRYYERKCMLLIDDYDKPIFANYPSAFYGKIVQFMHNFFLHSLSENPFLDRAIISGVLNISNVSVLDGISVYTLLNDNSGDRFGCTKDEVKQILKYYNLEDKFESAGLWYSYVYGDNTLYNPWSIINYLGDSINEFKPYWINSGIKVVIKELIVKASPEFKQEMVELFLGKTISKPMLDSIDLPELEKNDDAIWSFILHNGYLTAVNKSESNGVTKYDLSFPNYEIRVLFEMIVLKWLHESIGSHRWEEFVTSVVNADKETFATILEEFSITIRSYYKQNPNFVNIYYTLILGLVVALDNTHKVIPVVVNENKKYLTIIKSKENQNQGIILGYTNVVQDESLKDAVDEVKHYVEEKNIRQQYFDEYAPENVKTICFTINDTESFVSES